MQTEKNFQNEQTAKKSTESALSKEKEEKLKIQQALDQKTKDHEVAKYALKEIVSTHEEKQKMMVQEHMKEHESKQKLEQQLEAEKKKTAELERINKEKSQTKIQITKMPEASADGTATDKYLQSFANTPAGQTTTNVPIHLKITSENGQVQNVEQVSNTNYQPSAEEQTIKLPPVEVPKPDQGQENTIRIRLNQQNEQSLAAKK